jgi:endonuclease YncB( thermonuclease family)
VRLAHINAPEKSTQEGVVAREALVKKINDLLDSGDTFLCRTQKDKKEKYGRYLATLVSFKSLESLNQFMLDNKHAIPYM